VTRPIGDSTEVHTRAPMKNVKAVRRVDIILYIEGVLMVVLIDCLRFDFVTIEIVAGSSTYILRGGRNVASPSLLCCLISPVDPDDNPKFQGVLRCQRE
jgi:hypothetical protein